MIQNHLFDRLLSKWTNRSTTIYEIFPAPWHIQGSPEEITYIMAFSTAGFWHVLQIWLMKENPESPERLTATFLRALRKMAVNLED
ncbi:MAG: hypothetical protein ABF913_03200 [Oenococcus sp.]|uniref:hypothetical protein n=1 Tax=Oenococcus sp. TaxID=1979414 RepID=UPI0039E776DC